MPRSEPSRPKSATTGGNSPVGHALGGKIQRSVGGQSDGLGIEVAAAEGGPVGVAKGRRSEHLDTNLSVTGAYPQGEETGHRDVSAIIGEGVKKVAPRIVGQPGQAPDEGVIDLEIAGDLGLAQELQFDAANAPRPLTWQRPRSQR